MKKYSFNSLAGCVKQSKNRKTGYLVGLYNSEQAGIDEFGWTNICEKHHTCIIHYTLREANYYFSRPEDWCEECRNELENK
jgi:hypothetical protein